MRKPIRPAPRVVPFLIPWLLATTFLSAERSPDPTLAAFGKRVAHAREHLPKVIKAAEAAAERIAAHPKALIDVPYGIQPSFAEELLNRAGGLAQALPSVERRAQITPDDVTLLSVRSWEADREKMVAEVAAARKQGWLIVLFAPSAGAPEPLDVDFLIDNGALAGKDDEAAMNAIANAMNGWLWACEYVAALSRKGKHPGILRSVAAPGAEEHNKTVTRDRRELFPCEVPIPSGELAALYLKRVDKLLQDLAEEATRTQVDQAADKTAQHLKAGRKALVATCDHILMHEMTQNRSTPIQPFNVVWRAKRACQENVKPDDLVVFFGYIGVSTIYEDYLGALRETKARLVTSFIPDKGKPDNNAPEAVAHIAQHWAVPDAEVPVPFPPERMAPVSGLNQALLYRMLERALKARLEGEAMAKPPEAH